MQKMTGKFISVVFWAVMTSSAWAIENYTWQDINHEVGPESLSTMPAYLKVYTEAHIYRDEDITRVDRLPYTIYSADGKKVKYIAYNDKDPKLVMLPPGKYVIVPETNRTKAQIVGANLESGKLTEVHLPGENTPFTF